MTSVRKLNMFRLNHAMGKCMPAALAFMLTFLSGITPAWAATNRITLQSPDKQNEIQLEADADHGSLKYSVSRGGARLIEPSAIEPVVCNVGSLAKGAQIAN